MFNMTTWAVSMTTRNICGAHMVIQPNISFLFLLIWFSKSWTWIEASPTMLEYYDIAISGNKIFVQVVSLMCLHWKENVLVIEWSSWYIVHTQYYQAKHRSSSMQIGGLRKREAVPFLVLLCKVNKDNNHRVRLTNQKTGMIYFVQYLWSVWSLIPFDSCLHLWNLDFLQPSLCWCVSTPPW